MNVDTTATVMPGAYVCPGANIAANATIGPNACVLEGASVEAGATVGANATVMPGVRIGANARVEPGAVVARSVPPYAIVRGNPAVIAGYVDAGEGGAAAVMPSTGKRGVAQGRVKGVTLHELNLVADVRGTLSVGEFEREIPFVPKRYFLVFDVPTLETRGEHAHIVCHQFLVAVAGSVSVVADDGVNREEYLLDRCNKGVFLPAMTWGIQYKYSSDAVLLVFASEYYDSADYIRDYGQFLERVRTQGQS
jgi:UDP-2-acetamido-3-amino-2,3-dideoxy-glucuronate N-acetyltransferase